jgi:hypothetical protein
LMFQVVSDARRVLVMRPLMFKSVNKIFTFSSNVKSFLLLEY